VGIADRQKLFGGSGLLTGSGPRSWRCRSGSGARLHARVRAGGGRISDVSARWSASSIPSVVTIIPSFADRQQTNPTTKITKLTKDAQSPFAGTFDPSSILNRIMIL